MVETSDRIRRDIEDTRDRLSREIDELADRTLPHRIVKRGWSQLRGHNGSESENGATVTRLPLSPDVDVETDSMLDPEPTTPDEPGAAGRGRVLAIAAAAVGVGLALGWALWSRRRRRAED